MLRAIAAICLIGWAGVGCSPTLNWREVHAAPSLKAMLPCKPEQGARTVSMAGRSVRLEVMGCDAGGATFAVLWANPQDGSRSGEVLALWKAATLANMRGNATQESPFRPPGALDLPQSLRVVASGQRADKTRVESQAAYFARGSHVFQAVIYADQISPEAAGTFFSGLSFE